MPDLAPRSDASRPMPAQGIVRRLAGADRTLLRDHLLRLDPASRRQRFGGAVGNDRLEVYSGTAIGPDTLVKGLFVDGVLRGLAELRFVDGGRGAAELAFSIERGWQGRGHGTRLVASLLDGARNRGAHRLVLHVGRDNARMRAILRRHGAVLAFEGSEIVAEIRSPAADAASQSRERDEDRASAIERAVRRGLYALASGAGVDLSLRAA